MFRDNEVPFIPADISTERRKFIFRLWSKPKQTGCNSWYAKNTAIFTSINECNLKILPNLKSRTLLLFIFTSNLPTSLLYSVNIFSEIVVVHPKSKQIIWIQRALKEALEFTKRNAITPFRNNYRTSWLIIKWYRIKNVFLIIL